MSEHIPADPQFWAVWSDESGYLAALFGTSSTREHAQWLIDREERDSKKKLGLRPVRITVHTNE